MVLEKVYFYSSKIIVSGLRLVLVKYTSKTIYSIVFWYFLPLTIKCFTKLTPCIREICFCDKKLKFYYFRNKH